MVATTTLNGSVYALENAVWAATRNDKSGFESESAGVTTLERLGSGTWRALPMSKRFQMVPSSLSTYNHGFIALGGGCEPSESCPATMGPSMERITLTNRGAAAIAIDRPGTTYEPFMAVTAPNSLLALFLDRLAGTSASKGPGDTRVYDPDNGRWLIGPQAPRMRDWAGETWTPDGLVLLGQPIEKCACNPGGLILVPAKK